MAPCVDVYAWISPEHRRTALEQFIERYVSTEAAGDARFSAFQRMHVHGNGTAADREELADLRRDDSNRDAFSLYLHARDHEFAILSVTVEGAVVLGLSLDDPDNSPDVWQEGTRLLRKLCRDFPAREGLAGVELPPPQSWPEWEQAGPVLVRLRPADLH